MNPGQRTPNRVTSPILHEVLTSPNTTDKVISETLLKIDGIVSEDLENIAAEVISKIDDVVTKAIRNISNFDPKKTDLIDDLVDEISSFLAPNKARRTRSTTQSPTVLKIKEVLINAIERKKTPSKSPKRTNQDPRTPPSAPK